MVFSVEDTINLVKKYWIGRQMSDELNIFVGVSVQEE